MKATSGRSTSKPSDAKQLPASGLRTGKIHATKGSASEIRRKIGVTPADERIADQALTIAAERPKMERLRPERGGKQVVVAKRVLPATTKKR